MAQIKSKKLDILVYILNYYESSATSLKIKYGTIERVECERTQKSIRSAIGYLCRNLAQIILTLEYILTSTSDNESFIVEDFISEIHYVTILLRSPLQGNIGELINNVITTVEHISFKVWQLFYKINLEVDEFTEFEYQLLGITFEIGSANIKLTNFTTGPLEYEVLAASYKSTSETSFSSVKRILLDHKGEIMKSEIIRYIKCSLEFLNNHLKYTRKTSELPNTLPKVKDLLDIVSEYLIFHISTLSVVINTDNPIVNMLNIMDPFQKKFLSILQRVNSMVRSKSTEDETKELLHQGVIVFAEMMQNISLIYEIINCFRIYQL